MLSTLNNLGELLKVIFQVDTLAFILFSQWEEKLISIGRFKFSNWTCWFLPVLWTFSLYRRCHRAASQRECEPADDTINGKIDRTNPTPCKRERELCIPCIPCEDGNKQHSPSSLRATLTGTLQLNGLLWKDRVRNPSHLSAQHLFLIIQHIVQLRLFEG